MIIRYDHNNSLKHIMIQLVIKFQQMRQNIKYYCIHFSRNSENNKL
jgi:hypothetical protein